MVGSAALRKPRRPTWPAAFVFVSSILVFLPACHNGFVWDDYALIVRTLGYRGFDARHLHWMFTTTHMANYTPLAWLSYAVDFSIWRLNPFGYHLTNVLFHALNAVLLYFLSRLLLSQSFSSDEPFIFYGAAFAALAFSLSPLRVESVAWAAERRDVLAGFFSLSSILLYCRSVLSREEREHAGFRLLSIAAYLGAALSKATVVPLPAALLALDLYPLRRLGAGEKPARVRAVLLEKLPYAAIGLFAAAMALRAQHVSGNLVSTASHGVSDRLAQALYGLGFYVRMTALPAGLSALYPLAEGRAALLRHALAGAASLAAAAAILRASGVPRRAQLALWGFYAAMLLPVIGIVQNGPQAVALRYSYLSCLGWALLAGAAAAAALREKKSSPRPSAAALGLLVLWLAGNAWAARAEIAVWSDGRALWQDVARRYPSSPDANMNLADALLADAPREALAYAEAALRLAPSNPSARLTHARALAALGRTEDARDELLRDLQDDPDWGDGRALLGYLLSGLGRDAAPLAEDQLKRAAALLPGSAEAQANAGAILAMRGRFGEAVPYFERAARIDPANPSYAALLARARADAAQPAGTKGATTK